MQKNVIDCCFYVCCSMSFSIYQSYSVCTYICHIIMIFMFVGIWYISFELIKFQGIYPGEYNFPHTFKD